MCHAASEPRFRHEHASFATITYCNISITLTVLQVPSRASGVPSQLPKPTTRGPQQVAVSLLLLTPLRRLLLRQLERRLPRL